MGLPRNLDNFETLVINWEFDGTILECLGSVLENWTLAFEIWKKPRFHYHRKGRFQYI